MPEASGIDTLTWLRKNARTVPVIFMSGYADMATVVRAMNLGAVDFFEKPLNKELLIESIQRWIRKDIMAHRIWSEHKATSDKLATLSSRESQVLACVLEGMSNKETARILGVSPKAIELYRGHLMQKMNADNVVKLVLRVSSCVMGGGGVPIRPPCLGPVGAG